MNKIVQVKSTDGKNAEIDNYSGDTATNSQFGIPNFESRPFPDDETLQIETDTTGDQVAGLTPMDTAVDAGESRMTVMDSPGNVVGYLYLKKGGAVELTSGNEELMSMIQEISDILKAHVTPTLLGLQPMSPADVAAVTAWQLRFKTFTG